MKTTRIVMLGSIVALMGAIATGCATTSSPEGSPGILAKPIGKGMVTATVLHVETKVPLAGLPVTVRIAGMPDPTRPKPVLTNKMGVAEIKGLENGAYEALVIYNNHTSNIATFKVFGSSHANVMLFFNPDID